MKMEEERMFEPNFIVSFFNMVDTIYYKVKCDMLFIKVFILL